MASIDITAYSACGGVEICRLGHEDPRDFDAFARPIVESLKAAGVAAARITAKVDDNWSGLTVRATADGDPMEAMHTVTSTLHRALDPEVTK